LLSTGDILSGSLVGDLEAEVDPLKDAQFQAIIKQLNEMNMDAVTVGNHDVTDYSLDFFDRAKNNSTFPWISSNIKKVNEPKDFFVKPYVILNKSVDGIPIKIAVIGFTPPQITSWGRRYLEGVLYTKEIVEQANKFIPYLKEKTDLVIALAHTGISIEPENSYDARENAGYYLSQIDGIDAMILGHQHALFPGDFGNIENIDNQKGTINGVPSVMPGSWGDHLGIIELDLSYNEETGEWKVNDAHSFLKKVDENVKSDPLMEAIVKNTHEKTINYVRTPIGQTDIEINSYLSRVMDNPVTQIVNNAQIWWAKREFKGTEYENLPILSAAAPFIAGREGPNYFTQVKKDITIGSVTDIYIYPNTIYVGKLNGEQIIDWLETSGQNFNQIDINANEEQHVVNYDFRAYNFDVIEGINYVYDISKPFGERVVEATYNGKQLTKDMEFLIVTNNYRGSGGGGFPHIADNIILETTQINREIIIKYIQEKGVVNPIPTYNWYLKPLNTKKPLIFKSSPEVKDYLNSTNIKGLNFEGIDSNGWGIVDIDLNELADYSLEHSLETVK
jgi:2',3'-cyclic-nucleotide 2'-phosphodiesterase